ncbi:MAG: isoprenyl transferase [Phycisphaeraceae bacterium]|nr:isoprenyl transferase [Phycisphaeraceae bacterium]
MSGSTKPTTTIEPRPQPGPAGAVDLDAKSLPRHVAIIMDGNGRWARAQGKPRVYGHEHGARNVNPIVTECAKLGIEVLTLYAFSTENWLRSKAEVEFLMGLLLQFLEAELPTMLANNVRFKQIGRREGLSPTVLEMIDRTTAATAGNTGLTLALAVNYGSRAEITDAVRAIARKVKAGELDPSAIDQGVISDHLFTAGLPDPDLLIRTAGEMRLSNYLLWQSSYAELYVADVCWPDFDVVQLHEALRAYARRTRKFGEVVEPRA